jgi:hypothetical protein
LEQKQMGSQSAVLDSKWFRRAAAASNLPSRIVRQKFAGPWGGQAFVFVRPAIGAKPA